MKANLKNTFKDLQGLVGVPGCEQAVAKAIVEKVKPHVDEVIVQTLGNVIAVKKGAKPGPKLMIAAHMDEIGFIVKNILPNGFILLDKVGGVPDNIMLARKVWVGFNKVPGVIGTKPGHLQSPEEAKTAPTVHKIFVDLAVSSRAEVEKLGIRIGDPVVLASDFTEMSNPDFIATKAWDDRINCAIIVELLKNIKAEDFAGTIYATFTVREEQGCFGAPAAVNYIEPDYCLNLDTIPAGDSIGVNTEFELPIYLGKGVGFPLADGVGAMLFSFISPALRKMVEDVAAKEKINLQTTTITSFAYTTDSATINHAGKGVPVATLTVPRRYSHSPVELANINDAVDLLKLVIAMVKNNAHANLNFIQ